MIIMEVILHGFSSVILVLINTVWLVNHSLLPFSFVLV